MSLSHPAPLAALAAVAVLALAACGSDQDPTIGGSPAATTTTAAAGTGQPATSTTAAPATTTTTAGRVITVTVQGGSVTAGGGRERVRLNEAVVLRVTSDAADEVHVHTYDLFAPVGPGQPAEISFVASIPGVHEVELERTHRRLLTLEVAP
jgi:ABC-type glycerol-3-phosphate transport system substrate-binding protein